MIAPVPAQHVLNVLLLLVLSVGISLWPSEAWAGSMVGDGFQVNGTVIQESFGPVSGTAGQNLNATSGIGDVVHALDNTFNLYVNWFDQDTFVVRIQPGDAGQAEPFLVDITLSGLNFTNPQGVAETISGASFNPNGGGYLGYFADPINNPTGASPVKGPVVSFGTDSVRVVYGTDWASDNHPAGRLQLINDSPALFFDVRTKASTTTPEPETVALLCCGFVALGLAYRRMFQNIRSSNRR